MIASGDFVPEAKFTSACKVTSFLFGLPCLRQANASISQSLVICFCLKSYHHRKQPFGLFFSIKFVCYFYFSVPSETSQLNA